MKLLTEFILILLFVTIAGFTGLQDVHAQEIVNSNSTKFTVPDSAEQFHSQIDSLIAEMREKFHNELQKRTLPEKPIPVSQVDAVSSELSQTMDYIMAYIDREEALLEKYDYHLANRLSPSPFSYGISLFKEWSESQGCISATQISGMSGVSGKESIPTLKLSNPPVMPIEVDYLVEEGGTYTKSLEIYLRSDAEIMQAPMLLRTP
mgnify:FL=1